MLKLLLFLVLLRLTWDDGAQRSLRLRFSLSLSLNLGLRPGFHLRLQRDVLQGQRWQQVDASSRGLGFWRRRTHVLLT